MANFSSTDNIPDLTNQNKQLTLNCTHNNELLNIYVGNRSTDNIALGSKVLTAAYIGNKPIKTSQSYTHSCYLYCKKIYNESTKTYINPENWNWTIASDLFGANVSNPLILIHTACHNYAGFALLECPNNKIPNVTCKDFIDCQTLNYKNKLYLKIGPKMMYGIPEGLSNTYQSYKHTVKENGVSYNIYSTWCYINYNDGGTMQKPSTLAFYSKIKENETVSSSSPITKSLVKSGVVTNCHDYSGTGSKGTQFRLVILGNNHAPVIHFEGKPTSTETFSLGKNKCPTNSSSASTSPSPFKYSDNVTISNL